MGWEGALIGADSPVKGWGPGSSAMSGMAKSHEWCARVFTDWPTL